MFIGRERELAVLEDLYASDKFEFVVLYGRRQVGKTSLMQQFLAGKNFISCVGIAQSEAQNLQNLSSAIVEAVADLKGELAFPSFQSALEYVFSASRTRRLVLAIDEYPFMARSSKSLSSTLQMLIDRYRSESKLMIILCGSSISYMKEQVMDYGAPLYGRKTAQILLEPFTFREICLFYNNFSNEDLALAYGIVGGMPPYLHLMNDSVSIKENVKRTYLSTSSALFDQPYTILRLEFREPATYSAILSAIAQGASRCNQICTAAHISQPACSICLKTLVDLKFVLKENPVTDSHSKKTIYSLSDNMMKFWHRFISRSVNAIFKFDSEKVYSYIEPHLSQYMGPIFEKICREYVWALAAKDRSPVYFEDLGRWWGTDSRTQREMEIDLMGVRGNAPVLFGECKWNSSPMDSSILNSLLEKSSLFSSRTRHFFLFSKSGFTESCRQAAEESGNMSLVSLDDIVSLYREDMDLSAEARLAP